MNEPTPLVAVPDHRIFIASGMEILAISILAGMISHFAAGIDPWISLAIGIASMLVSVFVYSFAKLAKAAALAASSYRHNILLEHNDREIRNQLFNRSGEGV